MDSSHNKGDITGAPSFVSNFRSPQGLHVTLSDIPLDPYILASPEPYTPTQHPFRNAIDESFGNFPSQSNNAPQSTSYLFPRLFTVESYPLFFDEMDEDTGASGNWDPAMAPQHQNLSSLSTPYHDRTDLKQKYKGEDDNPTSRASIKFSPVPNSMKAEEHPSHSMPRRTRQPPEAPKYSISSDSFASQAKSSRRGHSRHHSKKSNRTPASAYSLSNAPRAVHNNNEKQYRNRLNGEFDILLSNLPEDVISADVNSVSEDTANRKPSKGRVLDLAAMHIKALERHCKALESENKELDGGVRMFEKAWKRRGREGGGEEEAMLLHGFRVGTNTLSTESSEI